MGTSVIVSTYGDSRPTKDRPELRRIRRPLRVRPRNGVKGWVVVRGKSAARELEDARHVRPRLRVRRNSVEPRHGSLAGIIGGKGKVARQSFEKHLQIADAGLDVR